MLERLLKLLQTGGTFRTIELARAMGTSPELVDAMLESLSRMGHLKIADTCGDQCLGCSLACTSNARTKIWTLANTEHPINPELAPTHQLPQE